LALPGRLRCTDALRNADVISGLRLEIKLHGTDIRDNDLSAGTEHLETV